MWELSRKNTSKEDSRDKILQDMQWIGMDVAKEQVFKSTQ